MLQCVSLWRFKLLLIILFAFGIKNEGGCFPFSFNNIVGRSQRRRAPSSRRLLAGWINDDLLSDPDMVIQNLILSLSKVTDDQSRRESLSRLFEVKLQDIDDGELFMKQFDSAMIIVGDRIRLDAASVAMKQSSNSNIDSDDETETPTFPLRSQQRLQLEGQLWACIDMMVQSKTLMKQARAK
jgi:hypothetical protein